MRTNLLLVVIGVIVGITAIGLILAGIISQAREPKPPPSPAPGPSTRPSAVIPYLESSGHSGESHQLQLKNLDTDGEFIGRAMQSEGITLHIDETFPGWETVSRRHARIYRDPSSGRAVIEDLGSQNGVYVQGRRTVRNLLKDGWTVAIGGVQFVYREPQADADQPTHAE